MQIKNEINFIIMVNGQKLRKLRNEKDLTLAQVGEAIGVTGQTISAYEKGNAQPPTDKLQLLCDFFGVQMAFILDGDNSKSEINNNDLVEELRTTMEYLKTQVDDLKKDKEFLKDIIKSKLFQDYPNFPRGNKKNTQVIRLFPELVALKAS